MLPDISLSDLCQAIPQVSNIEQEIKEGQKYVYKGKINGQWCALKVVPLSRSKKRGDLTSDTEFLRTQREVEKLSTCDTPHLVKLGPLPLATIVVGDQPVLYYTEEWVEGRTVDQLKSSGPLAFQQVQRIGQHVILALMELRKLNTIHRDIKPKNIMWRQSTDEYVLLDLGLALDQDDISLTAVGHIPGTLPYFSPEQCMPNFKRDMDYRSDLFSLGTVLYEVVTGQHPFYVDGPPDMIGFAPIWWSGERVR